ncbi:NADH dehydrogenase [ubiquinone] 1 alpha subcomplex assembly factor 2 isoform X2 [Parus major]|uniref:NADH dehydrogenase [ubiquinone] 1 alpha subcomplex assembly factor 2 isoform X2 n=1 Tax=Parus major TaxID=9157 RepID=UPI0014448053|nr:NADH dehydrogenase [ubiquinone] 1 alpha subcomplex assembly factor 2 isoform X2 [Parus major]
MITTVMFLFSLLAGIQMLFHRLFLREFRYKVMALGNWPLLQYSLCITSPLPCQSDINCEGHMEHMRVHVLREGQTIPERRFVETVNHEAYNYQIGDFPAEWEAWIRKKREDPPTIEMHAHTYMTCPAFLLQVSKECETLFTAEDSKLHPWRQILDLLLE